MKTSKAVNSSEGNGINLKSMCQSVRISWGAVFEVLCLRGGWGSMVSFGPCCPRRGNLWARQWLTGLQSYITALSHTQDKTHVDPRRTQGRALPGVVQCKSSGHTSWRPEPTPASAHWPWQAASGVGKVLENHFIRSKVKCFKAPTRDAQSKLTRNP